MTRTSTLASRWFGFDPAARSSAEKLPRRRQRLGLKVESLESRQMLSTTPIQFNVPTEVLGFGVYAAFTAQLTADYVNKGGHTIPNGTYVYYDNALADYAAATSSSNYSFQITASGQQAQLPNTDVKGGEIDIGVGSAPVISYTSDGFSTPTPSTSPTQIYGLVEYAYTSGGLDLDLSEVDQVGFPFTITSDPDAPAPAQDGVGLNLTRSEFFSRYLPYITSQGAVAAPFEQLYTDGIPYRLIAPQDSLASQDLPTLNPPGLQFGGALTAKTTYYYWVTGTSAFGETAPSNWQQVVTAPKSVNGHNVSRRTVLLNWTEVEGATGYNIYRSESSDSTTARLVGTSATTNFTDAGNAPGTQGLPTNSYSFNPLASYFNADLDAFFLHYQTNQFVLNRDGYTFSGYAHANYLYEGHEYTVLKLSTPGIPNQDFLIFKPYFQENTNIPGAPPAPSWMVDASDSPGEMVFGASGSFADGTEQFPSNATLAGIQKDLENNINAAFNRGIATNFAIAPDDWAASTSQFYQPGTSSNWYAAFLHTDITTNPTTGVSINGLAYGFAYDDNGGDSTNFQGNFNLVNINLMPWGSSPLPPAQAESIVILNQPVNGRVGSHEDVYFKVLGSNGHPYQGGVFVVGNLEGAEQGTYTALTDATTGIGNIKWTNTTPGTSHLQLALETGGVTVESNNFVVSESTPTGRWPKCYSSRGTSSRSQLIDMVMSRLGH